MSLTTAEISGPSSAPLMFTMPVENTCMLIFLPPLYRGQQQGILILPDVWLLGYCIMLSGRIQKLLNTTIVVISKGGTFLVVQLKNMSRYPASSIRPKRIAAGDADPDPG